MTSLFKPCWSFYWSTVSVCRPRISGGVFYDPLSFINNTNISDSIIYRKTGSLCSGPVRSPAALSLAPRVCVLVLGLGSGRQRSAVPRLLLLNKPNTVHLLRPQSAAAVAGFRASLSAVTSAAAPWTWTRRDSFHFDLKRFLTFWPQRREMSLMIL